METTLTVIIIFLVFGIFVSLAMPHEEINRDQFPRDFFFGVATSSYQIEGAILADGKGINNWDVFTHKPGNIGDGTNADVADDHYHRYEEDIGLMHSLGVNAYRFSIAWTRILPRCRFGDVNRKGIRFYNKLIDSLLQKGIEPFVTISHHEVPQELEERYQSWLSPLIQDEFAYYANICFKMFGVRVKYWITINEPNLFVELAYVKGVYPPGRCSVPFGNCSTGNSDKEPLIAAHNMILAHAKAANIYKRHYKSVQGGLIMLPAHAVMYVPISSKVVDLEAANRAMVFSAPWILDPVIYGDYPPEMRKLLGDDLPKFSPAEENLVKGSVDYIAFIHYSTLYAKDCSNSTCDSEVYPIDGSVYLTDKRNGIPIGEPTGFETFCVVPDGLEKLIYYLKARYINLPMFILENGIGQKDGSLELDESLLNDVKRVDYFKSYIAAIGRAVRNGANVRGYFLWTLMDDFEWNKGFTYRFGLYYVDYQTKERIPKLSAKWYKGFLTNGTELDQQVTTVLTSKN